MVDDIAISVRNLTKKYRIFGHPGDRIKQALTLGQVRFHREFTALQDVSFEIKKGEAVGIIGRNGSGKSTLLQLICGILKPTSGEVRVNGRISALLELGSGFNPEFTGRENVYFQGAVMGFTLRQMNERIDDIIAFADIGEFIDQPIRTYSSGMSVRLAFAVIAHVDADILVVDEALAVGDAFFTQKCMRFLRNFMKTGTVLFVSHDTDIIKNLCNYAVWLEKGQMVNEGEPKEICERYLEALYETRQGKGSKAEFRSFKKPDNLPPLKDQRLEFINASNLRNSLKIFEFDPEAASFGKGGAQITNVEFLGKDGSPLAWVVGGEQVTLRIRAIAHEPLNAPIIGFFIKDRLGQTLFGDNTYLSYIEHPQFCDAGKEILAEFTFLMPILPIGYYSVNAAIANGTQEQHVQHHWIYDAVQFRSESSSVTAGLIGVPMQHIKLNISGN